MELGVTGVMLPELDFDEQIALCQSLRIKYYQYRPRVIPEDQVGKPHNNPWGNHKFDLSPQRFFEEGAQLTAKLRAAGLEPWGTVPVATVEMPDADLRLHIEGAAAASAKCVRVQPYAYPDNEVFDYRALLARTVDRYRHVIDRISGPLGIKLIIETHCGSLATSPGLALNICRNFDPKQVGVIFDMANFNREGELNPALAVSVLRPYIDCVHIGGLKRIEGERDKFGCKVLASKSCALEDADLNIPRWVKLLRDAAASAPLVIEDYEMEVPGPDRLRRSASLLHRILEAA